MKTELGLRNRQRVRAVDLRVLRRLLRYLLEHHFRHAHIELGLHLVAKAEMAEINARFLRHDGSTDVITFDYMDKAPAEATPALAQREAGPGLHGEIFICLDDAVTQARQFRTTWPEEMTRYLIHGLLHLHGYDDQSPAARRVMKRAENRLLRLVKAQFPLRRLARRPSRRKLRPRNPPW